MIIKRLRIKDKRKEQYFIAVLLSSEILVKFPLRLYLFLKYFMIKCLI
jgi:hypothetical protein